MREDLGIWEDLEDKGCQKMNQMIPEDEKRLLVYHRQF